VTRRRKAPGNLADSGPSQGRLSARHRDRGGDYDDGCDCDCGIAGCGGRRFTAGDDAAANHNPPISPGRSGSTISYCEVEYTTDFILVG
jgi:hypothetical protein